jgi:hypothetical protein
MKKMEACFRRKMFELASLLRVVVVSSVRLTLDCRAKMFDLFFLQMERTVIKYIRLLKDNRTRIGE